MPGLLIIAHSPLASALKLAAGHTFAERAQAIEALDIPPNLSLVEIEAQAQVLLARVKDHDSRHEALILTDVFGATPCNVVQRMADGQQVKVITGCNVPMLWRVLNYLHEPLELLVARALAGGTQGVMQIGSSRPQNQNMNLSNDQNIRDHQQ
jgi:PTS system ascorbate-specific IIA component